MHDQPRHKTNHDQDSLTRANAYAAFTAALSFIVALLLQAIDSARMHFKKAFNYFGHPVAAFPATQAGSQLAEDINKMKLEMDLSRARIEKLEALATNFAARLDLDSVVDRFEHIASRFGQAPGVVAAAPVVEIAHAVDLEPLTAEAAIKILNDATGRTMAPNVEWAAKCLLHGAGSGEPKGPLTSGRIDRILKLGVIGAVLHSLDVMIRSGSLGAVYFWCNF